jgi:hypothetical protein
MDCLGTYNVEYTKSFREDKFSRAGGGGSFYSSIKNSLRAKFKSLQRI